MALAMVLVMLDMEVEEVVEEDMEQEENMALDMEVEEGVVEVVVMA